MNIIISLSVVVGFIYLGLCTKNILKERVLFFEELEKFLNEFKVNVSFAQMGLSDFINNFNSKSSDLTILLNKFTNLTKIQNKEKGFSVIKSEEVDLVKEFLFSIGKTDATNQLQEIEVFKTKISSLLNSERKTYSKYAGLSVKLSLMLGVMVVILLL